MVVISKNEDLQKNEERRVAHNIYKKLGAKNIKFLDIKGTYPDCYIEVDGKKIALELTRYYSQKETKHNLILRNTFRKWLNSNENILKIITNKVKRPLSQIQTIYYKSVKNMINDIIEVADNIEYIDIKGRYIYYNDDVNGINHTLPPEMTERLSISLNDYISYMMNNINNGDEISIALKCKNGLSVNVNVEYDKIGINRQEKQIHDWDVWWIDKNETFNNVLNAVINKEKKYKEKYSKDESIEKYDEYNLILYPEDVPPSLDKDEIQELIEYIKSNVQKLEFDFIIIYIWNQILVLSNKGEDTIVNF